MFKNYLKLTIQLLKRNKLFSSISILGMTIPLMFLMIIISMISHFTMLKAPESNFDRALYLDELKFSIKRQDNSGNMTTQPTYHFIKKFIKTMKTPAKVGLVSSIEFFNQYVKDKKTKLKVVYTDDVFWDIANFSFVEGKAYNAKDLEGSQLVAVIDEYTKKLVFNNENAIGKTMKIFKKNYQIIGVVKNVDISCQRTHSNIWIPVTTSNKYMVNDIFSYGCTCILLAKTKEQVPLIKKEYAALIKNFDLGSYDGLTKIDGELSEDSFNKKLKNIMDGLFSVKISENYTIYLAYGIIFFFFILLPSINLLYVHSSRISERSPEIGVRKAFGSAKQNLSMQFLFENIAVSILCGFLGLILSGLIFWISNSGQFIQGLHIQINAQSLAICLLLWLFFGLATGLFPAIKMSKVKIIDALNQGEIHKDFTLLSRKIKRQKIILVTEFMLTFISLAIILIFVIRFQKNRSFPLGFDYHDVYQVSVAKYDDQNLGFFGDVNGNDTINERIKQYGFVKHYGKLFWNEPFHSGYTTICDGVKYKNREEKENIHISIADENIKNVLKLKVIKGRWFDKTDDRPDYYPIVINETCKKRFFNDKDAVGEYLGFWGGKLQIVGVIDAYKYHGDYSTPIDIIFTYKQLNNANVNCDGEETRDFFMVKSGTSKGEVNAMARAISLKHPDYEINISSLESVRDQYINKTLGPIIVVITLFFLVLFIVLLGLFGVLWYDISLRKSEIGVRRATGATSGKIFKLVVNEMMVWATTGIILGIVLFIQIPILNLFTIEKGVAALSIIGASLTIYFLVLFCSLLPATQAAKIQPANALHEQ
jgi:putative ABC transport system permease protein